MPRASCVNSPDFQSRTLLLPTGLTPASILPPVFASVFMCLPAGLFQRLGIPAQKANERRGCIELTPPTIDPQISQLAIKLRGFSGVKPGATHRCPWRQKPAWKVPEPVDLR